MNLTKVKPVTETQQFKLICIWQKISLTCNTKDVIDRLSVLHFWLNERAVVLVPLKINVKGAGGCG